MGRRLNNLYLVILPVVFGLILGGSTLVNAIDWSNQDFIITDQNGNAIHWATGSPITVHNVTVTPNEVVFAPTENNEYRHWEFFEVRRDFDVTLDFLNASRADFTLFSGSGGSAARNVELNINGTIIDGWEYNGSPQLTIFTFTDPNCVFNPPDGDLLNCTGNNILNINDVVGGASVTVFLNNTRHAQIILESAVNVKAELVGNTILVSWEVPLNGNPERYTIQRSENGDPFIDRFTTDRQDTDKIVNKETKRQIYFELDEQVTPGSTYIYKIISVQGSRTIFAPDSDPVTVPARESGHTYVAEGNLLNTSRVITPQPIPVIGFDWYGLFQEVQAAENPILTTTLNPKTESYILDLTPIPSPDIGTDCEQKIDLHFKRDVDGGQEFTIIVTILEDQTIIRNQFTFDQISDSTKRVFNRMQDIPFADQTIQDFTDLEVQLDIDTTDDINPLNHRKLSIYEVNFIVPGSNPAC